MSHTLHHGNAMAGHTDAVQEAKALFHSNRKEGLARLNSLFREGRIPDPPPNGPYRGELVAVDVAPLVNQTVQGLASLWMPWKGKYLVREEHRGDNLFDKNSRAVLRVVFPFYRGWADYDADTERAFIFDTSISQGMQDKDRQVFRIDYDRPDNPALTIRRIVDEVVQVDEGLYLGKIHLKWWWGKWSMLGYFALRARS